MKGNNSRPRESDLLFWLFMLLAGSATAATGEFSKIGMGTWGGPHVRFAGWLLLAISICGIIVYLSKIRKEAKSHIFITTLFITSTVISTETPFAPVHPGPLNILLVALPLIIGHLMHKKLTANNGNESITRT